MCSRFDEVSGNSPRKGRIIITDRYTVMRQNKKMLLKIVKQSWLIHKRKCISDNSSFNPKESARLQNHVVSPLFTASFWQHLCLASAPVGRSSTRPNTQPTPTWWHHKGLHFHHTRWEVSRGKTDKQQSDEELRDADYCGRNTGGGGVCATRGLRGVAEPLTLHEAKQHVCTS